MRENVLEKACLCDHLGNRALIDLGILKEGRVPQAICPGPNIARFDRTYTLCEMLDHIYGRGKSLVPPERLHMFAKELVMYVDYFKKLVDQSDGSEGDLKKLKKFIKNLEKGMEYCLQIAESLPYEDEHLESISKTVLAQESRLVDIRQQILHQLHPERNS
ncbi:MAG: hypothetical protein U5K69_11690 [Balneolaceae bacterium]|nr:hypothetical protein [Balneolaceae bacterium]